MERFKFKLEPVLNHRKTKEDMFKKELAEIKQLLTREQQLLGQLKDKLSELHEEFRTKQQRSFDPTEAAAYMSYIDRVESEIEDQMSKLAEIAREVRQAQERLLEASKDKKVLEKLYDKQYEEFKREFDKVEQGLIDELATVRYKRDRATLLKEK